MNSGFCLPRAQVQRADTVQGGNEQFGWSVAEAVVYSWGGNCTWRQILAKWHLRSRALYPGAFNWRSAETEHAKVPKLLP